jgi:CheY-like chemotaxis protein
MQPVTVLVIEDGAEAALVCAALAKQPEIRVVDAPDVRRALKRLKMQPMHVAMAIVGADALTKSADELVKKFETRGIPVIGIATGLPSAAKQRALAAGVREIHDRPAKWQPYSELVGSLVSRFTRPN